MRTYRLLNLMLLTVATRSASAADGEPVTGNMPGYGNFYEMAIALVIVIAIIFVLAGIFKRLNLVNVSGKNLIHVLASYSLSNKDRLVLVQVGSEQILVGLSPGNIRKIHQLENPVDPAQVLNGRPKNGDFVQLFKGLLEKNATAGQGASNDH